jgi:hypothetical protein
LSGTLWVRLLRLLLDSFLSCLVCFGWNWHKVTFNFLLWRFLWNFVEMTLSFVSWLSHRRLVYFARQLSGSSTTHCWSVHLTNSSSAVLRCVFDHRRLLWWTSMFWRVLVKGFKHMRVNLWKICFCFCLSRGLLKTVSWCIDVLQA